MPLYTGQSDVEVEVGAELVDVLDREGFVVDDVVDTGEHSKSEKNGERMEFMMVQGELVEEIVLFHLDLTSYLAETKRKSAMRQEVNIRQKAQSKN